MPSEDAPPIDLSQLSPEEARSRVGELVELCLRRSGACVLLRRRTGEITVVDPVLLDAVPPEEMAGALLHTWSDEEILSYLKERLQRSGEAR